MSYRICAICGEQEDWKKKKEDLEKQCLKLQYEYQREKDSRECLEEELTQVKQRLKTQDFEMWMASVSFDKLRERNLELTKENQELKTKYALFDDPQVRARWELFTETIKLLEDIIGNKK